MSPLMDYAFKLLRQGSEIEENSRRPEEYLEAAEKYYEAVFVMNQEIGRLAVGTAEHNLIVTEKNRFEEKAARLMRDYSPLASTGRRSGGGGGICTSGARPMTQRTFVPSQPSPLPSSSSSPPPPPRRSVAVPSNARAYSSSATRAAPPAVAPRPAASQSSSVPAIFQNQPKIKPETPKDRAVRLANENLSHAMSLEERGHVDDAIAYYKIAADKYVSAINLQGAGNVQGYFSLKRRLGGAIERAEALKRKQSTARLSPRLFGGGPHSSSSLRA